VGIIGASFGGYLSALAVLERPDRVQAGVALAPVTEWRDYDTTYTERYLGLPGANTKGYAESSLLTADRHGPVTRLTSPLLLIHGTADDNVHFQHTLELIDALERMGFAPDVFLVPGQTHLFADQKTQEVMWATAAAFFLRHLTR
jgi:dipeptidyl-peptidase-4